MSIKPDLSLLKQIFVPKVVPLEEVKGIPPEVEDYKRHLGGLAWPDVKPKYYERHADAFCLMDHSTLKDFLGGFLHVLLSGTNSVIGESLILFAGREAFVVFCRLLNAEQIDFLFKTIDWEFADNSDFYSQADQDRCVKIRRLVVSTD